jgi:hypothetical protein
MHLTASKTPASKVVNLGKTKFVDCLARFFAFGEYAYAQDSEGMSRLVASRTLTSADADMR